jgi:TrpR-related protein YerC/YecD
MKRRYVEAEQPMEAPIDALAAAFLSLSSQADVRAFLVDLCTPAELEALADRWRVVPYLLDEVAYREIHARTSVSVTTIGRVARCLQNAEGGYQLAVAKIKRRKAAASARSQGAEAPAKRTVSGARS